MAWTYPDMHKVGGQHFATALCECIAALQGRREILELSAHAFLTPAGPTTTPAASDFDGTPIEDLREAILELRTQIGYSLYNTSGALASGPKIFVGADYIQYPTITNVLAAAGYPDGWIEIGSVRDAHVWQQLYDVLHELRRLKVAPVPTHTSTANASNVSPYNPADTHYLTKQLAWNHINDKIITSSNYFGNLYSTGAFWQLEGGSPYYYAMKESEVYHFTLNLPSGLTLLKTTKRFLGAHCGLTISVNFTDGESTWTMQPSDTQETFKEFLFEVDDGSFASGSSVDIPLSISTSLPATQPFDSTHNSDDFGQYVRSGYPVIAFYYDITPALTYG